MADKSDTKLIDSFTELSQNAKYLSGETPENISQRCLELCQQYLAGIWIKQKPNDIEVVRLTGGYNNQIYLCRINISKRESTDEPQEAVIRLYGFKYTLNLVEDDNRFNEPLVSALVSEHNLGPKVLGLFDEGQIFKYYQVYINHIIINLN